MNGVRASLSELRALVRVFAEEPTSHQVVVCPPATLIGEAVRDALNQRKVMA